MDSYTMNQISEAKVRRIETERESLTFFFFTAKGKEAKSKGMMNENIIFMTF